VVCYDVRLLWNVVRKIYALVYYHRGAVRILYHTVIVLRTGFYCNYLILINYPVLSCLCMYIFFNLERAKASTITVSTAIIT
jgi:hypothetical protein